MAVRNSNDTRTLFGRDKMNLNSQMTPNDWKWLKMFFEVYKRHWSASRRLEELGSWGVILSLGAIPARTLHHSMQRLHRCAPENEKDYGNRPWAGIAPSERITPHDPNRRAPPAQISTRKFLWFLFPFSSACFFVPSVLLPRKSTQSNLYFLLSLRTPETLIAWIPT
jgi:hypothetical protein